jgi:hypothetical protein
MMGRRRQRKAQLREVNFCDRCGQVCTAECRAQAQIDRTRATVAQYVFLR